MIEIGQIALLAALILAVFSVIAAMTGARSGIPNFLVSSRRAVFAVGGLVSIAAFVLLYSILTHNFQISYVYQYTSRSMPLTYLTSAFWAGNEGSLLLWAWVLALFGIIAAIQTRRHNREMAPYINSVVMAVEAFFLVLIIFVSSPFKMLPVIAPDGFGLNPLLESPGMLFHPPSLYLGYVGFTIPFAFAVGALITGRLSDQWIRSSRRWALTAWLFLSLGNLLGAWWAYQELGWGGYWAWDPVENASFMPWLVGTAYLHSVMIQQRRGMLKVWNIVLILITFVLVIFGTFLTRSGVISSVHSFGESSLGPFFLAFLGITIFSVLALLYYRLPQLQSENELDSLVSRESTFLLNNLILVGATFAILLGTMFPIISEAVKGNKITVGPPFFNQVTGPIFLGLIALMGICPLIGWRRASRDNLIRNFLYPLIITMLITIAMLLAGLREPYVILAAALCSFVTFTILLEVWRGVRSRHRKSGQDIFSSLGHLVWNNKPRYGGYIIHLGVILIAIGIVGSSAYKVEQSATLSIGESMNIEGYNLTYQNLADFPRGIEDVVIATLRVNDGHGDSLGYVTPSKTFHPNQDQPVTEVAIRSTLFEDLYVILAGWDKDTATFQVFVNPMISWIWIGGGILMLGTIVAVYPDARERKRWE